MNSDRCDALNVIAKVCACGFAFVLVVVAVRIVSIFSNFRGFFWAWNRKTATMIEAKKFIYAKVFVGSPKLDNFESESETLPALSDGGKFVSNCVID